MKKSAENSENQKVSISSKQNINTKESLNIKKDANTKTSWGVVADWYDEYLQGEGSADSYQRMVILPNLMRILNIKKGDNIADIACGQGLFSEEMTMQGAVVTGVDISPELIAKAKRRFNDKRLKATFHVSSADKLSMLKDKSFDKAICVLAAQNIKELDVMFSEASRVLKKGGRLVLVLNHPAFRIPKASDWHYAEAIKGAPQGVNAGADARPARQGRVVYQYLTEGMIKIDMNPGSKTDKKYTISYQRPLQVFVKWLSKRGFAITRLEEWISHKKSVNGPRQVVEDTARKEIPMFMCIEATLF